MITPGAVHIVGAGPGDPELITVRGLKRLRKADVVVYDRLVSLRLLEEAPADAELIDAGKAPGRHTLPQGEINALLISRARRAKSVVRLKGGDPFVFGRGGEECEALAEAGIPFEVIPGVSSAFAVPASAGIPLTHRGTANAFTVVTGHTRGPDGFALNWEDLPREGGGTLVILMGVGKLREIAERLMAGGRRPDTPAAVIGWGTTAAQTVVEGTLGDIAERAGGMRPPATIVIGDVVGLRRKLARFDPADRPGRGRTSQEPPRDAADAVAPSAGAATMATR